MARLAGRDHGLLVHPGVSDASGLSVTGTISLAARCHADVLRGASVLLFALLLVAWLVVAARTVSGAAAGRLFKPLAPSSAAASRALST
jgi:hypothetical protein